MSKAEVGQVYRKKKEESHFQSLETQFDRKDERTESKVSSLEDQEEEMTLNEYRKKQRELGEIWI